MTPQTEFQALITSLGESLVAYIGKDVIESLSVVGNEKSNLASVVIVPTHHAPKAYDQIIDGVIDVRGMFMGDIQFDYLISDADESTGARDDATASYAMA